MTTSGRAYEGVGNVVRVRDGDGPWRALHNVDGVPFRWGEISKAADSLAVSLLADHFEDAPDSAIVAMAHAVDAGLVDAESAPTFAELAVIVSPVFLIEIVARFARDGWFVYAWQLKLFIEEMCPERMKRDTWPATEDPCSS